MSTETIADLAPANAPRGALIWEADPTTFQFTYVSRSAEQLIGYSLEEWLTRPTFWSDVIHPDDRDHAVATCRDAIANCADHEFEYRLVSADHRIVRVRDIVRVVCNGCGAPVALRGAIVDVDPPQTSTHAQLTSAVAHDLNNVLLAIGGHASLALREPLGPEPKRAIEAIQRAAQIGAALAVRLQNADEPASESPLLVDVAMTIAEVHEWLRELAGEMIDVDVRLDTPSAPVWLQAGQVEQILLNLIVNAREAMPSGGDFRVALWCEPTIRLRPTDERGAVVIDVSDNGGGIAPELLPRIFERRVTTKSGTGSGIGLATVAAIVRQAGGLISVSSRVGAGTTFLITLPLAPIVH